MKRFLLFTAIAMMSVAAKAQLNPVGWTFTAKKIADKKYEVHITATIESGWHLFSQVQPEDAVAVPTAISFNKNALVIMEGKIKEEGKMEKFHDAKVNISAYQYSTTVDFIQVVKLKAKAKTNVSGKVKFQTCNDERCLPAKTITFSVALN